MLTKLPKIFAVTIIGTPRINIIETNHKANSTDYVFR